LLPGAGHLSVEGFAGGTDLVLAGLETVGCAVTLIWLFSVAVFRPEQRLRTPILAAAVLAVTVAQPFGTTSKVVRSIPSSAEAVSVSQTHRAGLLQFHVAAQDEVRSTGENDFRESIRARSSLWGPFLLHSTRVSGACRDLIDPPCVHHQTEVLRGELTLYRDEDEYWLVDSYPGTFERGSGRHQHVYIWRLSTGIASWVGVCYWLAIVALIAYGVRERKRTTRPDPSALLEA
jgi:hypothetical protein